MMTKKSVLTILLVPAFLLLVPLVANQTVEGFNWNPGSFVFAWVLMVCVGCAYRFVTAKAGNAAQRIATGIALGAGFMILWGNLAVGFIGSENNPANLMYGGVLAIGAVGAALARFEPTGMSRAMFATAIAQFLVPVVALIIWPHDFSPGVAPVFGLNFFFVLLFVVSGFLFRRSGNKPEGTRVRMTA